MKYYKYTVDSEFICDGAVKWTVTGNGEYITGTFRDKRYFIKRNMHVRYPDIDLPDKIYNKYKSEADSLQKKQEKIRSYMKDITFSDRIVTEEENFWDEENMFTTVTRLVPDALPENKKITTCSFEKFLALAKYTAELLQKIHAKKVIHGDIKEKNFVLTKDGEGGYVPYLIDFDSSYTSDDIPQWNSIGGTEGYQSPEVLIYAAQEGDVSSASITPYVDIFSLAVTWHRWWSGKPPAIDAEGYSLGAAVYMDKEIRLDKKFNKRIGSRCGTTLLSLINWMLAKDSYKRPDASKVIAVLNDESSVPSEFQKGEDDRPFDNALWDTHSQFAALYSEEQLKAKGLTSFKRRNEGIGSKGLLYSIIRDGKTKPEIKSINYLLAENYAYLLDLKTDEPWKEHNIEFVGTDEIIRRGYWRIKKTVINSNKVYTVSLIGGREFDKGPEWLVREGLAKAIVIEVETDEPWPEHKSGYLKENIVRNEILKIMRVSICGEHRYRIIYNQIVEGKRKIIDNVSVRNMKLMGLMK